MNDLLKLISNCLKPFGYHIRKHKAPNVLRLPQLEDSQSSLTKGYKTDDPNLDRLIVYLRTCIRANRNVDLTERLTQVPLNENTYRCVNSLIKALNQTCKNLIDRTVELIVLDDNSDEDEKAVLEKILKNATFKWTMRQTKTTGQGASLHQQFSEGKTENAMMYFVEDDYLHEPDGITAAWEFYCQTYKTMETHSLIYPQEHAVLYDNHYPSYLIKGKDRHWRTMNHATHTFMTHSHIVHDFWNYFENTKYVGIKKHRRKGSEARTTNKLFKHIPGFSPLKPVASHLQFENTMPPLYDWKPLWRKNKI